MNKKRTLVLAITGAFVVLAAVFVWIHQTSDTDPVNVDVTVSEPFDPSLNTDFVDNLNVRKSNAVGQDLEY